MDILVPRSKVNWPSRERGSRLHFESPQSGREQLQ
jgi:hypothetical protein